MNNKIIKNLVKLGIYNSKNLSEEDFNKLSKNNHDNSLIYIDGNYEGYDYYEEINTNNLTMDEIDLQLEIDITKNIRTIKNILFFFVIITIVGIITMLLILIK